jgi:hypothetical protein
MKPDLAWRLAIVKMALHRFANAVIKLGQILRFGEDGFAECASRVPAVGIFFYDKDDLVHPESSNTPVV